MVTAASVRELLQRHGELRSQPASDWRGPTALPPSVLRYYEQVGPVDVTVEGYGNPYFLPSLARLWEFQAGYSYHPSGHSLEGWNSNWLVVADEGADPFIFDQSTGRILHDLHGQGEWNPKFLFGDIFEMAACLAQIGCVVEDAAGDLVDDESYIQPNQMQTATRLLGALVDSETRAKDVLIELGWAQRP